MGAMVLGPIGAFLEARWNLCKEAKLTKRSSFSKNKQHASDLIEAICHVVLAILMGTALYRVSHFGTAATIGTGFACAVISLPSMSLGGGVLLAGHGILKCYRNFKLPTVINGVMHVDLEAKGNFYKGWFMLWSGFSLNSVVGRCKVGLADSFIIPKIIECGRVKVLNYYGLPS